MIRHLIRASLVAGALTGAAAPLSAHPHIFIDTGIEVLFNADGQAMAVRVSWHYDDFYSLMMIEDRQLDADHDGILTPEEQAKLTGFDMDWDADYEGDLFVLLGDQRLALGRPDAFTASYADGRIVSTHLRPLQTPVRPGADPLIVQVYDPGYYTAYTITGDARLTNAATCVAQVFEPDRDAADAKLQAMLDEYTGQDGVEMEFPAIGSAYADEVRVICPAA